MSGFGGLLVALALVSVLRAADGGRPHWRGPNDDGMALGDASFGWRDNERIAWKATVPGCGHSSPVIWDNRIFPTTAVQTANAAFSTGRGLAEHSFTLLCNDRKTGKLLCERVARVASPRQPFHPRYGSFASSSPITDGKHLYALISSRGFYCYTLTRDLVWQRDFGPLRMYNNFGEGAWTALDAGRILVVLDQEDESFLVALDKSTGRELWRVPRQGNTNGSGPYVTSFEGREQVIVSASRQVYAYDLETGKLLWSATGAGQITAAVASDGMVFVRSRFRNSNLMTIRLGREGDLSGTDAIVWQNQQGNSYSASPVSTKASSTYSPIQACSPALTTRPAGPATRSACPSATASNPRSWAQTESSISRLKMTTSSLPAWAKSSRFWLPIL
jgi:outer membrane protein assembly factor BamB